MSDRIEIGRIVKGKITGIQPYGAFVLLEDNKQGMIHISEIANEYVEDIHDYVKVGEEVFVKILAIDETETRIRLSLRDVSQPPSVDNQNTIKEQKTGTDKVSPGFYPLQVKLPEWIDAFRKQSLLKK